MRGFCLVERAFVQTPEVCVTPEGMCRGGRWIRWGDTGDVCVVLFFSSFLFFSVALFLFFGGFLGAGTGPVAVIIVCRVSTRGCGPWPCSRWTNATNLACWVALQGKFYRLCYQIRVRDYLYAGIAVMFPAVI